LTTQTGIVEIQPAGQIVYIPLIQQPPYDEVPSQRLLARALIGKQCLGLAGL